MGITVGKVRTSERIVLKKFYGKDDFEYILELFTCEEIMKMNYGRIFTFEECIDFYNKLVKENLLSGEFGTYKVIDRNSGKFIGFGAMVLNEDFTEAEIEYLLIPSYWGRGFGRELVSELLKIAEESEWVIRVKASVSPSNIKSKNILKNYGFHFTGRFNIDEDTMADGFEKLL